MQKQCAFCFYAKTHVRARNVGYMTHRERERLIKLYFSMVKILAQRPTHISVAATILLITKTFIVKYYDKEYRQIQHQ